MIKRGGGIKKIERENGKAPKQRSQKRPEECRKETTMREIKVNREGRRPQQGNQKVLGVLAWRPERRGWKDNQKMMDSKRGGATYTVRSKFSSQQIAMSEPSVTSSKAGEKNRMITGQPRWVPRHHITFNLEKLILQQLQPVRRLLQRNMMTKPLLKNQKHRLQAPLQKTEFKIPWNIKS